jgi:hypothetical protein
VHATWKEWKALYPTSLVLKKDGYYRSSYETYNRDQRLGIFGRRMNRSALPAKERILGVRYNGAATAFVVQDVRRAGLVETEVGGVPFVIAALDDNVPVVAFERLVRDRVLTFRKADARTLQDVETGSRWSVADGVAVDGPLQGERLTRVITHPAFWFGWYGFFPESAVWRR